MIEAANSKPETVYVTYIATTPGETGKPLAMANEGPPPEFVAAVKRAIAEKPWLKA